MIEAAHPVPQSLSRVPTPRASASDASLSAAWKPAYWSPRSLALLMAAIVASIALVYLGLEWRDGHGVQQWPVSQGRILAIRTHTSRIPAGPARGAAQPPSGALLQADILVSYTAQGHLYMRWVWLPSRADLPREQILAKAAQLEGTVCTVHWKHQRPLESFVTEYQNY